MRAKESSWKPRLADVLAIALIVLGCLFTARTAKDALLETDDTPQDLHSIVPMLDNESTVDDVCRRYALAKSLCDRSTAKDGQADLLLRPQSDRPTPHSASIRQGQ